MSSSTYVVTFRTSDNQLVAVDWEVFRTFGIYSPQDDPDSRPRDPIPLPEVDAATLKKVVEYSEHHKDDTAPEESDPLFDGPSDQKNISEWDSQFIQVDEKMLFSIILAANYLDIKPLAYLGTARVGELIKGRTPEGIRQLLTTANDFTPEEEAQIRRENGWGESPPKPSLLD